MIKKLKYFQSIVKNGSFSLAADACFISQSAISQQIKSLENELGVQLFDRKNRGFELTPAGEYLYRYNLSLIADFETLVDETRKISRREKIPFRFGYLSGFEYNSLSRVLNNFLNNNSDVEIEFFRGDHEELFTLLNENRVDCILSDQRRKFSDEYNNLELGIFPVQIECSSEHPLTRLNKVSVEELEKYPCFIVSSENNSKIERNFFRDILSIKSKCDSCADIEQMRLEMLLKNGYAFIECFNPGDNLPKEITRLKIYRDTKVLEKNYCLFSKKNRYNALVFELKELFDDYLNSFG